MSLFGTIRVKRAYYYCPRCRTGRCPSDAIWGLAGGDLSPAVTQLASLAGALESFAEASQKILPMFSGIRLGESTVERATEATGARLGRLLAEGKTFGPCQTWDWHRDAHGRRCAYLSVDATGVGQQGPGGTKAEGRMAYVGMVYNPVPEDRKEPALFSQSRYLAGLYSLEELGAQLRRQGGQVGMDSADVWIAVTDGGSGLEGFVQMQFPRAELILDFWHAAEHVCDLAKALYPGDEEASRTFGQQWCHTMKHKGGTELLKILEELDLKGRGRNAKEAHREVLQYVRNNVHRMDYPRYRAQGWQIGSGPVESACKTVVGQRLKGSGMRWGEEGADAVCHLRALWRSQRGLWEAFWNANPN